MSADLSALYRAIILDHGKRPRNVGRLAGATHGADGDNPLCGDSVHVDLELDGETVRATTFEGSGCAIAIASASLMTESLKGKTRTEAKALLDRMDAVCNGRLPSDVAADAQLGDLAAFRGVHQYPVRIKCATLAWHTMGRALAI